MRKIDQRMLRLLDDGYLIFVKSYVRGLEYAGEWPMSLDRHDELFFNNEDFWVCKSSELNELKTIAELRKLDKLDKILVTREVQGETVGVVMYPSELSLDVATWNLLRIWKMPDE